MKTSEAVAAAPVDLDALFAPWVEWREEPGRNGRGLIIAVNHRDGQGIYLDRAELRGTDPRHRGVMDVLGGGGFLADTRDARRSGGGVSAAAGAGLVWRGADRVVQRLHDRGGHFVFRPTLVACQLAVAVAGAVAVVRTFSMGSVQVHVCPSQIPAIVLLGLVAAVIHELGHAIVTIHYGRHVRIVGLRLHLGLPTFYVESVDALLLTRRQRLLQAAAGPWAEWLTISLIAFIALSVGNDGGPSAVLHRFVLVNTFVVFSNLLPFVGLDGALLFADAIGRPDLPFRASTAFGRSGPCERWIVVYSTLNALVAATLLATAMFFWWQLFGDLTLKLWGLGPLGITVLAVICSCLGCQLFRLIGRPLATIRKDIRSLRAKAVFRWERRWRVEAIHAFRALPELAGLGAMELGVIAGRLERARSPPDLICQSLPPRVREKGA